MCAQSGPMASPKMLTSIDYPAMVTAAQCKCMIIPAQPIDELDIHVQLRRSDRTTDCSRTQMTIVHRNLSNIICPRVDGGQQQVSGGGDKNSNRSSQMTISLSMTKNDRPVITLWNTHLEFISVQVILTGESQEFCHQLLCVSCYLTVDCNILFTCLDVSYGIVGSHLDWLPFLSELMDCDDGLGLWPLGLGSIWHPRGLLWPSSLLSSECSVANMLIVFRCI